MKNLITLFFIISLTSYSQDKIQQVEVVKTDTQIEEFSKQIGTKEFKLDFLDLLVFPALSLGYEKINDSSTAFGTTLFINLGGEDSDWNDNLAITPYYRFYFLQSEDYGGFMEFLLRCLLSLHLVMLKYIMKPHPLTIKKITLIWL